MKCVKTCFLLARLHVLAVIIKMTRIVLHRIKTVLEHTAAGKINKNFVILDDTEWSSKICPLNAFTFLIQIISGHVFRLMWWCYWYDIYILSSWEVLYSFPSLSQLFWWFQSNMKSQEKLFSSRQHSWSQMITGLLGLSICFNFLSMLHISLNNRTQWEF